MYQMHRPGGFLRTGATLARILLVCLLLTSSWKHAQASHVDSLLQVAETYSAYDTARARIYTLISREYLRIDPDSTFSFARKANRIFAVHQDQRGIEMCQYLKFRYYFQKAELDAAMEELTARQKVLEALKDTAGLGQNYYLTGVVHSKRGEDQAGVESMLQGLAMLEAIRDSNGIGRALINVGAALYSSGNINKSLEYFKRGADFNEAYGNLGSTAIALNNIGSIYSEKGDYQRCLQYLERGLRIQEQQEDVAMINTLYNMAIANIRLNRKAKGKALLDRALTLADRLKDREGRLTAFLGYGEYHAAIGRPDSATYYLETALLIARDINMPDEIERTLRELAYATAKNGDHKGAFEILSNYHAFRDSVEAGDREQFASELAEKYEAEKKEAENALLREKQASDERTRRLMLLFFISGGIILLLLAIMLAVGYERKRRHNELLAAQKGIIAEKNRELETINHRLIELNEEKDTLMGVVAHDLKAPLNKAQGLLKILNLAGPLTEEQERYIALMQRVFDGGQKLIEELVLISRMEGGNHTLDMVPADVDEWIKEDLEPFKADARLKSIELVFDARLAEARVSLNRESFDRIFDNLVSNALKFSHSNTRVQVTTSIVDGQARIAVRDEGQGIPANELPHLFGKFTRTSVRPTAGESSSGLGLFIVKKLTEKMGGTVEVDSTVDKGSTFAVTFPLTRQAPQIQTQDRSGSHIQA